MTALDPRPARVIFERPLRGPDFSMLRDAWQYTEACSKRVTEAVLSPGCIGAYVLGRRKTGKSTGLLDLAAETTRRHGDRVRVCYFDLQAHGDRRITDVVEVILATVKEGLGADLAVLLLVDEYDVLVDGVDRESMSGQHGDNVKAFIALQNGLAGMCRSALALPQRDVALDPRIKIVFAGHITTAIRALELEGQFLAGSPLSSSLEPLYTTWLAEDHVSTMANRMGVRDPDRAALWRVGAGHPGVTARLLQLHATRREKFESGAWSLARWPSIGPDDDAARSVESFTQAFGRDDLPRFDTLIPGGRELLESVRHRRRPAGFTRVDKALFLALLPMRYLGKANGDLQFVDEVLPLACSTTGPGEVPARIAGISISNHEIRVTFEKGGANRDFSIGRKGEDREFWVSVLAFAARARLDRSGVKNQVGHSRYAGVVGPVASPARPRMS